MRDADVLGQPAQRGRAGRIGSQPRRDRRPQARDRSRERVGAAGRFAQPEWDARRLALRVLHPHRPPLDALNAIGGVAELEHVAGHALDGEVLVDAADDVVLGLQHHLIVGGVGDRAAGGQRRRPRPAPAPQHMVDGVVMNERAAPAPARGEAVGQHLHDRIEIGARQLPIRPGAAQAFVELPLPANPARRSRRRSAGLARRAAGPGSPGGRVRRGGRCRAGRRIPPDRHGKAETAGPSGCRRPHGRTGRPAAESWRSSAAIRAGRRDPHRRYRCRARARRSRPALSACRSSGAARRRADAPSPCCRDAR